jgi:hypothetical protein
MKDVLDASQWANPALGNIVLSAFFAPLPDILTESYRPVGMSARELLKALIDRGYLDLEKNYFQAVLSADRSELVITLDLVHTKGASPCSYGYLENRIAEITAFWVRGCYYKKMEKIPTY